MSTLWQKIYSLLNYPNEKDRPYFRRILVRRFKPRYDVER